MMELVLVVVGLLLAVGLLSWLPLSLGIDAEVRAGAVALSFSLGYAGLRLARHWLLPVRPPVPHSPSRHHLHLSVKLWYRALWVLARMENFTDRLWSRMVVRRFNLSLAWGCNDAAATAVWTGRAALVASWWIAARVAPRARCTPEFNISPHWGGPALVCDFTSIIQLRPSDIILAAIASLREHKGGRQHGSAFGPTVNGTSD